MADSRSDPQQSCIGRFLYILVFLTGGVFGLFNSFCAWDSGCRPSL
jgi:hypothetical protein